MSVSLTVRWVFGYHVKSEKPFGLDHDEYGACNVESVECMGGNSGSLVFATASEVCLLNDRNGYEFDHPVITVDDLPRRSPSSRISTSSWSPSPWGSAPRWPQSGSSTQTWAEGRGGLHLER